MSIETNNFSLKRIKLFGFAEYLIPKINVAFENSE